MNTLTQFFFQEDQYQAENNAISQIAADNSHSFEVIENETITDCNYENVTVSGSLFSFAIFSNVTFKNCTFYANKIENCIFEDCEFIDCKFEFSSFNHTNFLNCEFERTSFAMGHLQGGSFKGCAMEQVLKDFLETQNINLTNTHVSDEPEEYIPEFGFEEMADHILPSAA